MQLRLDADVIGAAVQFARLGGGEPSRNLSGEQDRAYISRRGDDEAVVDDRVDVLVGSRQVARPRDEPTIIGPARYRRLQMPSDRRQLVRSCPRSCGGVRLSGPSSRIN